MVEMLSQIVNGLVLGNVYALVAIGFSLIFGVTNLINFAQGSLLMLGAQPINDLAPGAQLELHLPVTVHLRDKQHTYEAELLATRLDEHRFQVVTLEPLMLQAEDFGVQSELESLRKLAGLSAISFSVPVSAVLIFTAR